MKLEPGWLKTELATIDAEIAKWPTGVRESFESLKRPQPIAEFAGIGLHVGPTPPETVTIYVDGKMVGAIENVT